MYRKKGRDSVGSYLTVMDAGMFNSLHWGWRWWRVLGQSETSWRRNRVYVRQRTVINKGWPMWASRYRVRITSVENDAFEFVQTMTFHYMEDCAWTMVCTTIILLYFLKRTQARCGPIETLCCKVLYWNMTSSGTNKKIPPGAWLSVSSDGCVLSGRGFCDELITRPEKSYWLVRRCVWSRKPRDWGGPGPLGGLSRQKQRK